MDADFSGLLFHDKAAFVTSEIELAARLSDSILAPMKSPLVLPRHLTRLDVFLIAKTTK